MSVGFNDGISQPYVIFADDSQQRRAPLPGQNTVNPGVLVLGQPGDQVTRPSWAKNGSFAAYRHLKQLVPEFNDFLKSVVLSSITVPPPVPGSQAPHSTGTDTEDFKKRVDFLGARLMGRWKSGMISVHLSFMFFDILVQECLSYSLQSRLEIFQ
jgi:hypothetical protein